MTLKHAKKFDHLFSCVFIFSNIFAQGHCFDAVMVTGLKYFISLH